MKYRVYRIDGSKQFVETSDLKFANSIAKEERKRGYEVVVKEKKGERWYTIVESE